MYCDAKNFIIETGRVNNSYSAYDLFSSGSSIVKMLPYREYFQPLYGLCAHLQWLYITHSESEALYIVDISRMRPVKFFEDALHRFLIHANAVVFKPQQNFG